MENEIHLQTNIQKKQIRKVLQTFFLNVDESLKLGNPVKIRDFGVFYNNIAGQKRIRKGRR